MIQIAICDDDMTTTSQIEEYIRQIETKQHIQVQSRIFLMENLLCKVLRVGKYMI